MRGIGYCARPDMLITLPNILTLYRIAIVPVLLGFLYVDTGWAEGL